MKLSQKSSNNIVNTFKYLIQNLNVNELKFVIRILVTLTRYNETPPLKRDLVPIVHRKLATAQFVLRQIKLSRMAEVQYKGFCGLAL